jgi:hypothetical protein
MRTGSTPTRHWSTMRARGGQAERLRPLHRGEDDRGRTVGDLRRGAGGVHAVLPGDGLELLEALDRGLAEALVARHPLGLTGGLAVLAEDRCVDRDDLALEAALLPRLRGALLGLEPEGVGVVPRDAPLLGDALGPLELARELVVPEVGLRDRAAGPVAGVAADRDPGHDLDPARHGDVDRAGADERCGEVGRLLARPALRVDGRGGHREGQAGAQPGGAGHVERLLADLADAPADHLADRFGVDVGTGDRSAEHAAEEVGGWMPAKPPLRRPTGCGGLR